jgi:hypothetical protein
VKGVVCFVGVRSSSGIGVSGRSLKVGAVDGQLPRLIMDCEEQLPISLLESSSCARGPRFPDGRAVASRRDDESGEDKDVFKRPSLMRLRSSSSATWSPSWLAIHVPLILPLRGGPLLGDGRTIS